MNFDSINNVGRSFLRRFSSGNKKLDDYLRLYAKKNEKKHISRTYVLFDNCLLIGYVTLSAAQIDCQETEAIDPELPRYPIPGVRIARLAVDKKYQHNHYGEKLLAFAVKKVISIAKEIGIKVIVVDAKEQSKAFYEKYGFVPLPKRSLTLVLPIDAFLE